MIDTNDWFSLPVEDRLPIENWLEKIGYRPGVEHGAMASLYPEDVRDLRLTVFMLVHSYRNQAATADKFKLEYQQRYLALKSENESLRQGQKHLYAKLDDCEQRARNAEARAKDLERRLKELKDPIPF